MHAAMHYKVKRNNQIVNKPHTCKYANENEYRISWNAKRVENWEFSIENSLKGKMVKCNY